MPRERLLLALALLFLLGSVPAELERGSESKISPPEFQDVTESAGLDFKHINGPVLEKNYIPETKGGGAGFFDYDGDGWLDVYLVQGSTLERYREGRDPYSRLYRNRRDGTFEDVTIEAGLDRVTGWGMGVTFGDYDNDGDVDIYATCLGPNRLLRNEGDGTFVDVSQRAGVSDPRWSTSAAFADYDGDGDLDLYVANYVYFNADAPPPRSCRHREAIVLCGPMGLPGVGDALYRNEGDGTFVEVSDDVGAADPDRFYGLGVVWSDLDGDHDQDLYVANDATPNLLFENLGGGRFQEVGLISGLAVNAEGRDQASMGLDSGDYNNDGRLDLYSTHFADDYSTLYRNEGNLFFRDVTAEAGILRPEIGLVSWGFKFVDFNHDGWKDIFHSNGHVYPYLIEAQIDEKFRQPTTLYLNRGDGTFLDSSRKAGRALLEPRVGRGSAFGDYDNDGDIDALIANLNERPTLLRTEGVSGNWLMVRLRGVRSNRDAVGAWVELEADGLPQYWEVKRSGSIYSAHDPRAHFGIGEAEVVDRLSIRWPSGQKQSFENIPANRHYELTEGGDLEPERIADRQRDPGENGDDGGS